MPQTRGGRRSAVTVERREHADLAVPQQWPPEIWTSLTNASLPDSRPAYDYCAEWGYGPLLVLWVRGALSQESAEVRVRAIATLLVTEASWVL
jgi:hypothetical protein